MRLQRIMSVALGVVALSSPKLPAQQTAVQLLLGGGSATDARGISSNAMIIAPSLMYRSTSGLIRIGLTGTNFTSGGWALGGGAGLELRSSPERLLGVALRAAGSATATSYHAAYSTASAVPALELRLAHVSAYGGVRAAVGRHSFPITPAQGPLSQPERVWAAKSSIGPTFGGRLELASSPHGGAALDYREEHTRIDSLSSTDRIASLSIVEGAVSLMGSLGVRVARPGTSSFGGVSATIGLSRVLALELGAEQYPADLLTGVTGGRSVTAAFMLRTPSGPRPLPRPSGVTRPAGGLTRLSIAAPDAITVEIAGDWNGWQPVETHRASNGVWYADLGIPAGTYRYAFRINRREWRVPAGARVTDDAFGGKSAWLTVGS
jgi:hypothetical protein